LEVEVPANTTAEIYVPSPSVDAVTVDGVAVASVADVKVVGKDGPYTKYVVGSGKYKFVANR
jgi:alpha-L-rhamnosidase